MGIGLIKLDETHEKDYFEYVKEWGDQDIVPYSSRPLDRSYNEFLRQTTLFEDEMTCPSDFVPAYTYFLVDDGILIGAINIRLKLNEFLLKYGGHIGYGIRPSERKKGYATKMLNLALQKARGFGLTKVLITCDKDNIGSAKTILNNNGIFENELLKDDKYVQRYWIEL